MDLWSVALQDNSQLLCIDPGRQIVYYHFQRQATLGLPETTLRFIHQLKKTWAES